MSEAAGYIAAYLREADRERYLASLFSPAAKRPAIQAIAAFAADIASIPPRVREPQAGEIRLQWWVDALTGAGHGDVRQNPIAAALLDTLEASGVPAGGLVRLLEARRFDLYNDPMPDMPSFEGYAGETESVLFQVSAMLLAEAADLPGDAAGHIGVARALAGHLRAFGYNASRGRLFLPLAVFTANGVGIEDILSGKSSPAMLAALGQVADLARDHLAKGRAALRHLPATARPAFALASLLGPQLKRMRGSADPFGAVRDISDLRKLLAMTWQASAGQT